MGIGDAVWNQRIVHQPRINPFKTHCWKQFGGGPLVADLRDMDPLQNPATRLPSIPTRSPQSRGESTVNNIA